MHFISILLGPYKWYYTARGGTTNYTKKNVLPCTFFVRNTWQDKKAP